MVSQDHLMRLNFESKCNQWDCCMAMVEKQTQAVYAWPIVIHKAHRAHSSWLAQSQVIHPVQSWGLGGLLLLRQNGKQEGCFLLSPVLIPRTSGSVLHLRGGLGPQDGGCIMSWGGFTVRFATRPLYLCPSLLNVPLLSKATKSLLTWKLWTHGELIRVSARRAICMWIGRGCIPGLFMSFTPQCLGLLSPLTSHCRIGTKICTSSVLWLYLLVLHRWYLWSLIL